jgi:endonuclease/exonuclease/phosphatase family metal-dependent hydrolase
VGTTAAGAQLPHAPPLTVVSFNIRYGTAADGPDAWPTRASQVIDLIRALDPDVLGLQEALRFQLDQLGDALPEYGEIGVGREDGRTAGEYAAILYRRERLQLVDQGTFWLSDTPTVPNSMSWGNRITRIATWARFVDRSTRNEFAVFNVHFDHESQPSRERSAVLVASRLPSDVPVILLGDFNAGEENRAMRYLTGRQTLEAPDREHRSPRPLRDTYRAIHRDEAEVGTFHGFRGGTAGEKIDAILASPAWEVLDAAIVRAQVDGRYPSDHYPVTTRLRWRGPRP